MLLHELHTQLLGRVNVDCHLSSRRTEAAFANSIATDTDNPRKKCRPIDSKLDRSRFELLEILVGPDRGATYRLQAINYELALALPL